MTTKASPNANVLTGSILGKCIVCSLLAGITTLAYAGETVPARNSSPQRAFQYILPVAPESPYFGYSELFISGVAEENALPPPPPKTGVTALSQPQVYRQSMPSPTYVQNTTAPEEARQPHYRTPRSGREAEPAPAVEHHAAVKFRNGGPSAPTVRAEGTQNGGKESKEITVPAAEAPLFTLSGTAGWYSRYMFRGLDVSHRTGIDGGTETGFFGSSVSGTIGNFALTFWNMDSLEKYVPGGAGADGSFGHITNPKHGQAFYANPLDYQSVQPVRYEEYDLFANYTVKLPYKLALTAGMNFYWFNDGRFWADGSRHVNNTEEAATSLNWTGIPYLNQTVSYAYDFDAFKGSYLSYTIATNPIKIYKSDTGPFSISLVPNVSVSYDFRYNGTNNGWNNFAAGVDMPIRIADGLVLNLGANYSRDLGDNYPGAGGQSVQRTDNRFWFSAAVQYSPDFSKPRVSTEREDKKMMVDSSVEIDPGPWRISAGAGVRNIHTNFHVGSGGLASIGSLFGSDANGGDLGFASASSDANYLDGSVFSKSGTQWFLGAFPYGTSNFSFANQSQVQSYGTPAVNRQVTYHSNRTGYDGGSGFNQGDDDDVVYPYISFDRRLAKWAGGEASVGLMYSFNHSSSQSGFHLAQTANESSYFFTYDVDNLFGPLTGPFAPFNNQFNTDGSKYVALVYNSGQYSNAINQISGGLVTAPFAGPQKAVITRPVLGVFRNSKLDTDLHAISLPLDVSFNVTNRIQVHLSAGPTFNIFNEEQQTDTYYQLIDEGGSAMLQSHRSPYITATGQPINVTNFGPLPKVGIPAGKNVTTGTHLLATSASNGGGGKGSSNGQSRELPGTTLRHDVSRHGETDFRCGVFGEFTVTLDLDAAKRWFVETYARYDYVPKFSISDGITSTSIDASSWGAGVGIGFRF